MSSHSLALTSAPQNRTSGNIDISSYDDDYSQNQSHYGIPAPLHYRQEGGGMYSPWRLFEERIRRLFEERVRTGPYGLTSFPSQPYSPIRILILTPSQERVSPRLRQFVSDSPPSIRNDWQLGLTQHEHEEPGLSDSEFKKAMKKLRKEVFNPSYPPKKKSWKGLFGTKSKADINITDNKAEEKNGGNSCIICLEAFVSNEHVLVTPCNHMFHNDCLVPWVKSHGKCPVCRSVLCERRGRTLSQNSNNYNNDVLGGEDESPIDLISLIRAMEEALDWVNNSH